MNLDSQDSRVHRSDFALGEGNQERNAKRSKRRKSGTKSQKIQEKKLRTEKPQDLREKKSEMKG